MTDLPPQSHTTAKGLENAIKAWCSKMGHRLFRCNSGQVWQGKEVLAECPKCKWKPSVKSIMLLNPRRIHLHEEGFPDTVGFSVVEITPEMVGERIPVFTAIELKTKNDRLRPAQKRFLEGFRNHGTIAGVARAVEDVGRLIREWQAGFKEKNRK